MPNLSTVIICVVIFAVCVAAVISYLKKISGGCCGSGGCGGCGNCPMSGSCPKHTDSDRKKQ